MYMYWLFIKYLISEVNFKILLKVQIGKSLQQLFEKKNIFGIQNRSSARRDILCSTKRLKQLAVFKCYRVLFCSTEVCWLSAFCRRNSGKI